MDSEGRPTTRAQAAREELRLRRQEAILDLALEIVTTQGHDALTMQRIADELECGIASVYRLFPSKDSLIAELLHHSLDVLHASYLLGLDHLTTDAAAADLDPTDAALAKAIGAAWFWVIADDGYPSQMDLARRLFIDRRIVVPTEQAAQIVPASLRLLNEGRQAIDDAVDAGALDPGNGVERAIVLVASITGVVLTAKFSRWDQALFDERHLAAVAVKDSFRSWGAPPERLDRAMDVTLEIGRTGRLAPPVERALPLRNG